MKKILLVSCALGLAFSAFAADVTGKWNGKMKMDMGGMKKQIQAKAAKMTGDAKKQALMGISQIELAEKTLGKSVIQMELRKDGVVIISDKMSGKQEKDQGKWKLTGNKIVLSGFTGKNGGPKVMNGVVMDGGKTLFFDLSDEMKKQARSRGAQANVDGKLTLTFKR